MNKSLVGVCWQSNTHGVDTLLSAQLLSQPTTCRSPIPYTNRSFQGTFNCGSSVRLHYWKKVSYYEWQELNQLNQPIVDN